MFGKGSHSIVLEDMNTKERYYVEVSLKRNKEILWIDDYTGKVIFEPYIYMKGMITMRNKFNRRLTVVGKLEDFDN
jgi:hypothetical protein